MAAVKCSSPAAASAGNCANADWLSLQSKASSQDPCRNCWPVRHGLKLEPARRVSEFAQHTIQIRRTVKLCTWLAMAVLQGNRAGSVKRICYCYVWSGRLTDVAGLHSNTILQMQPTAVSETVSACKLANTPMRDGHSATDSGASKSLACKLIQPQRC